MRGNGRGRRILAALCCLALALPMRAAGAQAAGGRVNRALLVGVDAFVSRESTYPSSTNNVFSMQAVFQSSAEPFMTIAAPEEPLTSAQELTRLIQAVFSDADADDVSYLYLSTHGEYDPYTGAEPTLLLSDGMSESRVTPAELEAAFSGIRGTKVLLLDACNSGAFIGKGMREQPERVYFLGDDFKVLTSSGAMEESWYWNTAGSADAALAERGPQGGFYFTQAMSQGMSPEYGFPADGNRDGDVTLSELYDYLLRVHAASTPQVYPQTDDFVVFSYDREAESAAAPSPVRDVTFSEASLAGGVGELTVEYITVRPVRVAYQVVYQREGKWRFDDAKLIYDDAERYTAFGDEEGAVSPGHKVRALSIEWEGDAQGGYVIVQLVTLERGRLTVHAGRVLCAPPATGDPKLTAEAASRYILQSQRELSIFVGHLYPCTLSVAVVDESGAIVRRLCHRQGTRPMQISPEGSVFYWDGLDQRGAPVPEGTYYVRASAQMNGLTFTVLSNPIMVRSDNG